MTAVADARIDGSLSQQVFDVLLRSLAEPGTIRRLPTDQLPAAPTVLWLPLAIADVDISVNVDDDAAGALTSLVRDATAATLTPLDDAAIVVLTGVGDGAVLDRVRVGSALAPEDGARVAIAVEGFEPSNDSTDDSTADSTAGVQLHLEGPGVPGTRSITVRGLDPSAAARLGQASGHFPAGFDTWLFSPEGDVVAISRSTTITIEGTH